MMDIAGGSPAMFFDMPAEDAAIILIKAKERRVNDRLFLRWAIGYQQQVSFDEFKESVRPRMEKPAAAIIDDVYSIIDDFGRRGLRKVL